MIDYHRELKAFHINQLLLHQTWSTLLKTLFIGFQQRLITTCGSNRASLQSGTRQQTSNGKYQFINVWMELYRTRINSPTSPIFFTVSSSLLLNFGMRLGLCDKTTIDRNKRTYVFCRVCTTRDITTEEATRERGSTCIRVVASEKGELKNIVMISMTVVAMYSWSFRLSLQLPSRI